LFGDVLVAVAALVCLRSLFSPPTTPTTASLPAKLNSAQRRYGLIDSDENVASSVKFIPNLRLACKTMTKMAKIGTLFMTMTAGNHTL